MRKPSQHSIDLYNQLVERQNQIRKTLIRVHRRAEETFGAGRLPALVVPKSAKKIKINAFTGGTNLRDRMKMFWQRYREAKALFGRGLRGYIAKTVKQGYMELWRDQILEFSGESPEGAFSKFTNEQIENSSMGSFMEVYNKLVSLSPEAFLAMLYAGKLIQFKYIYDDMRMGTGDKENSWLQQQKELLTISRKDVKSYLDWFYDYTASPETQTKSYESPIDYQTKEGDKYHTAESYSGRHKKSTSENAQKRYDRSKK